MGNARFIRGIVGRCAAAAFLAVLAACGGGGGPPPAPQPVALAISGLPAASMLPGQSVQLTATLTYSDTSTKDVTASAAWSTTNAAAVSVSSAGAISAVAPGQAEVAAAAQGLTARGAVTVATPAPQPAALSVSGIPAGWMLPAQSAQLRATVTYSDGSTADVTAGTAWSSTSTSVFTVSSAGMIQSVEPGQAEVVASAQGMSSRSTVRVVRETPRLALFAGSLGGAGNADGSGATARFTDPHGLAVDSAGNVYVADRSNNTIRKITAAGVVSTLAGEAGSYGSVDGPVSTARFLFPEGVATDRLGNVYVAEIGALAATIRKITRDGFVTTLAGSASSRGTVDGTGSDARFEEPMGMSIDGQANLYVADYSGQIVRRITPEGVVSTLAGKAGSIGSTDGVGTEARFNYPSGTAVDRAGNVYVADQNNHTIRRITPAGMVSTIAGRAGEEGSTDGAGSEARFKWPRELALDNEGNLYLTDQGNHTVRKISAAGVVSTVAGRAGSAGSSDGAGVEARFSWPSGIGIDGLGNVLVSDEGNNTVRRITPAGIVSTLAGAADLPGSADGTGTEARFSEPYGVSVDDAGNLFVADYKDSTVRKITATGVVSTLAGMPAMHGNVDGVGAAARFRWPSGTAVDRSGNVYVADTRNNSIRRITAAGLVMTVAGSGSEGSADGSGTSASFAFCHFFDGYSTCLPTGLAVDRNGNIYAADVNNHTIRRITPEGVVSTFAGKAGAAGSTDGVASEARFDRPRGLAFDSKGNLYVAESTNKTIRKVTPQGLVSTLAGKAGASGSVDGIGADARFSDPQYLATDGIDNVYVADLRNHTIRKIDPLGAVTTIVGLPRVIGFAPGTLPGVLASPRGIAISGSSLYITLYNGVAVVTNLP